MLASAPIISSPDGRLLLDTVRQDPDGLWRPIRIPGQRYRFHPYNGEWGWLAWEEAGQGWFVARMDLNGPGEPIPLPPGVEGHLAVAPDGELRAGTLRIRPDGTILRSLSLGWIPGAVPGPGGSWLTPGGDQLIPIGDGLYRVVPWRPQGDGLAFRFLWIGDVVLARQGSRLVRIAHPGAAPEVLANMPGKCWVFPDGRWLSRHVGEILAGGPEGSRVKCSFPGLVEKAAPLHEGWWIAGEDARSWWIHEDGSIEELPPIATTAWRDGGEWRIWPGQDEKPPVPAVALFRGGGELHRLPPIHAVYPGWAQDVRGRLWHLPGDGRAPRRMPPEVLPKGAEKAMPVGTVGAGLILLAQRFRSGDVFIRLLPDGSRETWELPYSFGDNGAVVELGPDEFVAFLDHFYYASALGRLAPGRAVWAPPPPSGGAHREIRALHGGWAIRWGERVYLLPKDEFAIGIARAL